MDPSQDQQCAACGRLRPLDRISLDESLCKDCRVMTPRARALIRRAYARGWAHAREPVFTQLGLEEPIRRPRESTRSTDLPGPDLDRAHDWRTGFPLPGGERRYF